MIILYISYFLLIFGTLGALVGYDTKDPLIRFLNLEVVNMGVCLAFLAYDMALALMTFIAVNTILTIIFVRSIILYKKLEDE
ncbi:hypothetical protein J422_00556 [Methanocaldococcus villosus KIN24-T80]|uniref:(NiFe)-hydrogenase-3-type complex Eha, membrane protein EhaE n=1 Tax=Methanocaldococcus villosus KIN24-T80 TaxID=1069083 RepID=N6W074_9EURY|nr:EhaE family protein [Methanocaldococcus villosus]ENN96762.1 hypothetical protein J422_00556 [Methanocaldococcus villosus KIN24-T80]